MAKSILSTLCYFDIFDYPLTLLEIWQWFLTDNQNFTPVNLSEIKEEIENNPDLIPKVKFQNGFYFLTGREKIVDIRLNRYAISSCKNQLARKGVKILRFLPFIKFVGLGNNAGNNNVKLESDIDLFIITAKNRLFTARFLITLVLGLMRLRRHGHKITDRLCLSFYAAQDNLDFSKIKINDHDIYLVYWLANLFPLYDRGGYSQFILANGWVKKYLPNNSIKQGSFWRQVLDNRWSKFSFKVGEFILSGFLGNFLESFLRPAQLFKMSKNKKSLARANDNRVIISSTMLKFHENDRRLLYQTQFKNKLAELL